MAEGKPGVGQGDTRGTHQRGYALSDRCAAQRTRACYTEAPQVAAGMAGELAVAAMWMIGPVV